MLITALHLICLEHLNNLLSWKLLIEESYIHAASLITFALSWPNYQLLHTPYTVFRQINAPCALTDTLVSAGGPGEYHRGFSGHFGPIFTYFEGNMPTERAGAHLSGQARLFGEIQQPHSITNWRQIKYNTGTIKGQVWYFCIIVLQSIWTPYSLLLYNSSSSVRTTIKHLLS